MTNITENRATDNYFSLLGLPVSFTIEKNTLNENYHELQKSVHPDKYANTSDLERRLSVQKAAQINDAFETLKNPLRRSIYLLSLLGIELGENDSGMDPGFLMEQMELRENLSQVGDKDDPLGALDDIMADVKQRINQVIEQLTVQFENILSTDSTSADTKQGEQKELLIKEAKSQVLKMQFLNRLQEECLNKEEDLADQI